MPLRSSSGRKSRSRVRGQEGLGESPGLFYLEFPKASTASQTSDKPVARTDGLRTVAVRTARTTINGRYKCGICGQLKVNHTCGKVHAVASGAQTQSSPVHLADGARVFAVRPWRSGSHAEHASAAPAGGEGASPRLNQVAANSGGGDGGGSDVGGGEVTAASGQSQETASIAVMDSRTTSCSGGGTDFLGYMKRGAEACDEAQADSAGGGWAIFSGHGDLPSEGGGALLKYTSAPAIRALWSSGGGGVGGAVRLFSEQHHFPTEAATAALVAEQGGKVGPSGLSPKVPSQSSMASLAAPAPPCSGFRTYSGPAASLTVVKPSLASLSSASVAAALGTLPLPQGLSTPALHALAFRAALLSFCGPINPTTITAFPPLRASGSHLAAAALEAPVDDGGGEQHAAERVGVGSDGQTTDPSDSDGSSEGSCDGSPVEGGN